MNSNEFKHPKDQIVEIMQRIYDCGMTTTSGGNLSIMDSDGNMWISPASVDKGTLRREDIVCVKADGKIDGIHKPSSEYPFHSAVYKMRHDIRAILHAHPPTLVSFSVAGKLPTPTAMPSCRKVCPTVGFAGYDVPGSKELGDLVGGAFAKGHNAILLENHGSCVADRTLLDAFKRFETLDFCARAINNAIRLGQPNYLTESDMDKGLRREKSYQEFIPEVRSSTEMELRRTMAALVRRSYKQQLFTSTQGDFAVRLDADGILVTPADADRATLEAGQIVLVRGNKCEKGKKPSCATAFIQKVFAAQPDLGAIATANPPHLMGYAISHEPFDPRVIPESYILLREMPAFAFGDVDGAAAKLSQRYPVLLLQNDCIVSAGRTALEAYDRMEVAEYSAKATLMAGGLGGMKPIDDKQVADLVKAFHLLP